MNTTPKLNWEGRVVRLTNYGCGLIGLENDARAFWQSRMTVTGRQAPAPVLVDLKALARSIRATCNALAASTA